MAYKRETQRWFDYCKYEYADTFCRLGEVLLSFSSGVLLLVTFGSSYWMEQAQSHSGLWQKCAQDCHSLPLITSANAPAELLVARTFMCLALGAGILAWVISIVGLLQHRARWLLIAAVCYAVQAGVMTLGLGSYSKSFNDTSTPGWSYSVGWVACVLCVMCTLYFVSVAIYRIRNPPTSGSSRKPKSYAPLAQFESTETDDDEEL